MKRLKGSGRNAPDRQANMRSTWRQMLMYSDDSESLAASTIREPLEFMV